MPSIYLSGYSQFYFRGKQHLRAILNLKSSFSVMLWVLNKVLHDEFFCFFYKSSIKQLLD